MIITYYADDYLLFSDAYAAACFYYAAYCRAYLMLPPCLMLADVIFATI